MVSFWQSDRKVMLEIPIASVLEIPCLSARVSAIREEETFSITLDPDRVAKGWRSPKVHATPALEVEASQAASIQHCVEGWLRFD